MDATFSGSSIKELALQNALYKVEKNLCETARQEAAAFKENFSTEKSESVYLSKESSVSTAGRNSLYSAGSAEAARPMDTNLSAGDINRTIELSLNLLLNTRDSSAAAPGVPTQSVSASGTAVSWLMMSVKDLFLNNAGSKDELTVYKEKALLSLSLSVAEKLKQACAAGRTEHILMEPVLIQNASLANNVIFFAYVSSLLVLLNRLSEFKKLQRKTKSYKERKEQKEKERQNILRQYNESFLLP